MSSDHVEHLFVCLQKLRLDEGGDKGTGKPPKDRPAELSTFTTLDNHHAGVFTFSQPVLRVNEGIGTLMVTVVRGFGYRGTVVVPYHTENGSAKAGVNYEEKRGELEFTDGQTR